MLAAQNKTRITLSTHAKLQKELRENMVSKGYSFREKSKWVSEAIEILLSMSNYPELVSLSGELFSLDKTETIIINEPLKKKLDEGIIRTRKEFPLLEGVQSRIVRTSIVQRLLRE